jgi:hypothetical protein
MVLSLIKEKALRSVFGPLEETLKQKTKMVYSVLAVTFLVALVSLLISIANRSTKETTYWYDPHDVIMIEEAAYVTVYQR